MSISTPFIKRPVATTLLTIALALAGGIAFMFLPVAPLPQVEFPTIQVSAGLPGASPEIMASAVATPLERQLGRIAGITEMTSNSGLGSTGITIQFDLNRNIDAAARDVQAAINAARGQLPANLPNNPTYRKTNPADSPIMMLALTSKIQQRSRLYDIASTVLEQKLSQVDGVGQVTVGGSSLPSVRVELNPQILNKYGIGFEQVRAVLNAANANRPKGQLADETTAWEISTTDQLLQAKDYMPLIVSYHQGSAVRLQDLGTVADSVENLRNDGVANGEPAILLMVMRQPGANIIETVNRIKALMPQLQASAPASAKLAIMSDQTTTIRASVKEVEKAMLISIGLVILVVFLFLRNIWATMIPGVVVPLSLVGTFGIMYLLGFSVNNLSLMALTISTGFVVDDAIVVIENITRHLEQGMKPMAAALQGAREIGFTVLSMSTSLIAVFIPILLMGGIVGRLFREFAITLSGAIALSLVVSLTTTPMMCARMLKPETGRRHSFLYRAAEGVFNRMHRGYQRGLQRVLRHPLITMVVLLLTVGLNFYLYKVVPKGFFPQQDTGRITGSIQADQDVSFQAMREKFSRFVQIVQADPAVDTMGAFLGAGGNTNTGRMFVTLKPLAERRISADQVIARLRGKLSSVPGANLYLQANQDVRVGGFQSNSQFQYILRGDNLDELRVYAPKVMQMLRQIRQIVDVNSNQQDHGLQAQLVIDRDTASRLGITAQQIDATLYDSFGQRPVSTMYKAQNQYHVVMEAAPEFWQNPDTLKNIYVQSSSSGGIVPLSAFTHYESARTSLSVPHQGQFPAVTFSFALAPSYALGDAVDAVNKAQQELGLPATIHASFLGTALAYEASLANQPWLILAALVAVYIVLGILYESYIHPVTILSTLPSAGVGAILALMLCHMELSIIALIGIILLIGIVKKNAIMMIDFALAAERQKGLNPKDAIYEACLLRFRPIMMTTMAAILGGLPLVLGTGVGSELRRPLGVTIVGGLMLSQILTLFTTPVVYLYLDRFRLFIERTRTHRRELAGVMRDDAKGEIS